MRKGMMALLALSLVSIGGLLLMPGPAHADSVSDKIDEARIKARAGDPGAAASDLESLARQHPDDPRIHYYRARFLADLDRRNEAADTIEVAETVMQKYRDGGGKDQAILGIGDDLAKLANDLLQYRRQAREVLTDYRVKGMRHARNLLKQEQYEFALYVVDEVAAAMEHGADEELVQLRSEIEQAAQAAPEGE